MARRCELTGVEPRFGHNVSHSNVKTNRRFDPNLQRVTLRSDALGGNVRMRITTRALRTIQRYGGIDSYLLKTDDAKLAPEGQRLKRRVKKAIAGAQKRSAAN